MRKELKNILVPVDFMPSAQKATENITLSRAEYEELQAQVQSLTSQLDWFTYRLAQRPGSYVILEYTRPVYKLLDDLRIATTPAPANVLEHSVADVSFLAGMLVDKFGYHRVL